MGQGHAKPPSPLPALIKLFLHICYNHIFIAGFWFSDHYFIAFDVMREDVLLMKALLGAAGPCVCLCSLWYPTPEPGEENMENHVENSLSDCLSAAVSFGIAGTL